MLVAIERGVADNLHAVLVGGHARAGERPAPESIILGIPVTEHTHQRRLAQDDDFSLFFGDRDGNRVRVTPGVDGHIQFEESGRGQLQIVPPLFVVKLLQFDLNPAISESFHSHTDFAGPARRCLDGAQGDRTDDQANK